MEIGTNKKKRKMEAGTTNCIVYDFNKRDILMNENVPLGSIVGVVIARFGNCELFDKDRESLIYNNVYYDAIGHHCDEHGVVTFYVSGYNQIDEKLKCANCASFVDGSKCVKWSEVNIHLSPDYEVQYRGEEACLKKNAQKRLYGKVNAIDGGADGHQWVFIKDVLKMKEKGALDYCFTMVKRKGGSRTKGEKRGGYMVSVCCLPLLVVVYKSRASKDMAKQVSAAKKKVLEELLPDVGESIEATETAKKAKTPTSMGSSEEERAIARLIECVKKHSISVGLVVPYSGPELAHGAIVSYSHRKGQIIEYAKGAKVYFVVEDVDLLLNPLDVADGVAFVILLVVGLVPDVKTATKATRSDQVYFRGVSGVVCDKGLLESPLGIVHAVEEREGIVTVAVWHDTWPDLV